VFDGGRTRLPSEEELIPLPRGSDLFFLPDRNPVGIDPESGSEVALEDCGAAVSFAAPAFLRLAHPVFVKKKDAVVLPLFAYAPLGFLNGRFYTCAVRIDRSRRQDPSRFDIGEVKSLVDRRLRRDGKNRLITHLAHCAVVYQCRAAQNFFYGREECPLPASPGCNSECAGCLSHQPEGSFKAAHERIRFVPSPEEIAEVALSHLERVKNSVVSFGQGCEGEPLLAGGVIEKAVTLIRKETPGGTININTNGCFPDTVKKLCDAGLDSLRLSLNSARELCYNRYFNPRGYSFKDALLSARIVHENGGFVSLNLFIFPGFTDTEEEFTALEEAIEYTGADMIQMRNLNIDADFYIESLGREFFKSGMGLLEFMRRVRADFPRIRFGYFNPRLLKNRRLISEKRSGCL